MKIVTNEEGSACWMGPQYPNASNPSCNTTVTCGTGCLFDLIKARSPWRSLLCYLI